MKPYTQTLLRLLLSFGLLLMLHGQLLAAPFPVKEWVAKLEQGPATNHDAVRDMVRILTPMDSSLVEKNFDLLKKEGRNAGPLFQLRILHARIWYLQDHNYPYGVEKIVPLLEEMMQTASATGNKELIAYASWIYGYMMYSYFELEPAVTYSLQAVELYAAMKPFDDLHFYYSSLGEMLFHTGEFSKSIRYTKRALELNTDTARLRKRMKTKDLNTIGQCYQQLSKQDSALWFYHASTRLADSIGHTVWQGINASDIGHLFYTGKQYAPARYLFWQAYAKTLKEEPATAANSLQFLARIQLLKGNTDSASAYLQEAIQLLDSYGKFNPLQVARFRKEVYAAKAELFTLLNQPDSANFYQQRFRNLRDSLERVSILSSSKLALLRIENEKNQYLLKAATAEKKQVTQRSYFFIVSISMLAIITILILNRQKKELAYQEAMGRTEKRRLEEEVLASREKLQLFTQTLLEKSSLVQQLEEDLREKELTASQQQLVAELTNLTILTEEDWNRFRSMFEKVYPGFFQKLRQLSPDITVAEQRMAALIRLELDTKQMAAMLGISFDGVHKARQRLRSRLQLNSDINLQQYIANLDA